MKNDINQEIEKEAVFGITPILQSEKIYGFMDAFLVLSGYCIATWSYTQGSYLATLVNFKQLLIGAFLGAILMLVIYQLPVILSVRYGIDVWIWLRSVFGHSGVKIMTVIIIVINFPWYAVCAELFSSSMTNLAALFGLKLPDSLHAILGILCVLIGTFIAYKGIGTITWTTRILVPLLLGVGVMVVIIGFTSVPFDVIWNYKPVDNGYSNKIIPYIISIEANFAFVITLVGGMSGVPRLTKNENSGFWAGVLGQGLSGSFFVVVGAVMSIAMQHVTGKMIDDATIMLATLSVPALALASLLLVAFANIGTQAVGSYLYAVMLKSSFKKADYRVLIMILALYVSILCVWGKIIEFFGSFLTLSACIYAPLAALLFVDFFFVRKQKLALRSAFGMPGYHAYDYTKGINWIGFFCVGAGIAMSLLIYNPITGEVHNMFLFHLTPTGFSFMGTGILYYIFSRIPSTRKYLLRDREELTV
ncbi:cytosine permease [Acetivibrio cellulolyticus]|uniref:cytosine permease n=1 Tax=Acetivibrio cellulolyticus TaxID=35830 RepID=UPI0001E2C2BC|nr:cytosine permease [Acetivibrio cellulolyticus]